VSYDEPKILSSQLNQFCLKGADVGQTALNLVRQIENRMRSLAI